MSKPLDTRTVEYAYAASVLITPNVLYAAEPVVGEFPYKHIVKVQYELKDTDKKLLAYAERTHLVDSTGTDSVATYIAAVAAALPDFVAADKLELSGYAPT
jgi:hypothetical protein